MAEDGILVLNAGSSSIKFALFAVSTAHEPAVRAKGQIDGIGSDPQFVAKDGSGNRIAEQAWSGDGGLNHASGLRFLLGWIAETSDGLNLIAAGHRVVHGGVRHNRPVLIDAAVMDALAALNPLAPLHQPHNLAAIRAVFEVDPHLPQVACFDTAFHRTLPAVAQMFALPKEMTERGVRRYGFHGLSYEYVAKRMATLHPAARRVVVAHLGNGASMCAIQDGASIESTMGFTAVDGLPMGTRTGALDPGVVLYLMQDKGFDAKAIETLLYKQSGLLGVSGLSNDMRTLLASDDADAALAVELFVYHIAKQLGALTAALGGLDALVFTAGIGENAAEVRARVMERSAWLGIRADLAANEAGGPRLTTADSPVPAWVVATDEERMIALHTLALLSQT